MVRKAVIPAAGLGTRLMPLSGALPKEMLPVGGVPMILYCLEEAAASGIDDVCVVLSPGKRAIEDYLLELRGGRAPGHRIAARFRETFWKCRIAFAWQEQPLGLADAIYRARWFLGQQPFAVMLPDNIIISRRPAILQIRGAFEKYGKDTLALARIPARLAHTFSLSGLVEYEPLAGRAVRITRFHRKRKGYYPAMRKGHVIRGIARAIFLPHFFDYVDRVRGKTAGELDDGPVLREMLKRETIVGRIIEGKVFDAGNPLGFAAAEKLLGQAEMRAARRRQVRMRCI